MPRDSESAQTGARFSPSVFLSFLSFSTHNTEKTTRQNATLSLLPFLFLFSVPLLSLSSHPTLYIGAFLLLLLALGLWRAPLLLVPPRCLFLLAALFFGSSLSLFFFKDSSALFPLLAMLGAFLPFLYPETVRGFLPLYGLLGGIVGLLALLSLLLGKGAFGYADAAFSYAALGRSAVFFGNPNLLAAFLLPAPFGCLASYPSAKSGRLRFFLALALLFSVLGIGATLCRGAWLALGVSLLLFLALVTKSLFWPILALCLFPGLFALLPPPLRERILSVLTGDSSVSYRLSLWRSLLSLPPSYYLLGIGEGKEAFSRLLLPYLSAGLEHVEHTHSLFLHFLITEGIGGLFLLLVSLLPTFFSPIPKAKEEGALALALRASLFSLLLFGLFDDPLYTIQTGVIFFWLLGVNLSLQSSLSS